MLMAGYHKGFSKTKRLKVIHRFLPREISILVIYYLWLALPYWEDMQANVWEVTELPANLWAPEEALDDLSFHGGPDGYGSGSGTSDDEHEGGARGEPKASARRLGPGPH
ncbi:hypothetical protein NW754_001358 [Fusarium falciforme]|nr:hypothetical protein NW754_001358 [Fusarium falciforme]